MGKKKINPAAVHETIEPIGNLFWAPIQEKPARFVSIRDLSGMWKMDTKRPMINSIFPMKRGTGKPLGIHVGMVNLKRPGVVKSLWDFSSVRGYGFSSAPASTENRAHILLSVLVRRRRALWTNGWLPAKRQPLFQGRFLFRLTVWLPRGIPPNWEEEVGLLIQMAVF